MFENFCESYTAYVLLLSRKLELIGLSIFSAPPWQSRKVAITLFALVVGSLLSYDAPVQHSNFNRTFI